MKTPTLLLATLTVATTHVHASWRFDFGAGAAAPGWTAVSAGDAYSAERGYGFDRGITPREFASPAVLAKDPLRGDGVTAEAPFYFSVKVPEGNYRVTVTFGGAPEPSRLTVKAESRRLMVERAGAAAGAWAERTFIVNVRDTSLVPPPRNAPGGTAVTLNDRERVPAVLHWDDKLTLEFSDEAPHVCAIDITRADAVPTIFLAGDSTVTDQPGEPGASWGQMLPRFFQPTVAIANHAESGETLKSFVTAHRLDKILQQMRAGDWLFIQFGHNDSKSAWPQTYVEPFTTYDAWLRVFIAETRRRGATPVLVTSPQRRAWEESAPGRIRNTHGDYPEAVRRVADDEGVALIDLHATSTAFYEALGPERAPLAFSDGGRDATHHNNYGAYELAKCIVEGIRARDLALAQHLVPGLPPFDPAHPDDPAAFDVPASPGRTTEAPRGN